MATLYFSGYPGPGIAGNADLYTLDSNGDPVAIPINSADGSNAGEDGGFYQFDDGLYFNANGSATGDTEALYKIDASGDVTAVSAGANSFDGFFDGISGESANFTEFDDSLYFSAEANTGGQVVELKADGSSQVITLDSGFQSFAGQNGGFVAFDGDLYFSAITTETNGFNPDLIQLAPNGTVTEISTRSVADEQFGSSAGEDGGFQVFNNDLYFNAYSDTLGDTLFELAAGSTTPTPVDPTGTVLSHLSGDDSAFHVFDGALYFNELNVASGDDTLFKLDASGTLTPLTFNNGTTDEALQGAGEYGGFTDFSGSAYFVATTQVEGTQLFKLDAAGAVTEVTDVAGGAFDANLVSGFVQYAGSLFFDAYNPTVGDSLYKLDANDTLTAIEPGVLSGAGVNGGFQVFNGNLYFYANDSSDLHPQLIALDDNTTNGITFQAHDVNLGESTNSFTSSPTDFGGGPPCFASGTRILTDCGAVAVENLAIGDRLITQSGEVKPIKWIGHISLVCSRSSDPRDVWPIRVAAGAFAENKPSRDLWLSPGHNIAAEGVLMPISAVQNGKTIVQHERATVEYWHIELDKHDIIFAEDLAVESYLDTGNRAAFANGVAFIGAHPDFEPSHWSDTCLPLIKQGREVTRAKAALLERLGCVTTPEADIHVMADRKRIEPIKLGAMRFAFTLPPRLR